MHKTQEWTSARDRQTRDGNAAHALHTRARLHDGMPLHPAHPLASLGSRCSHMQRIFTLFACTARLLAATPRRAEDFGHHKLLRCSSDAQAAPPRCKPSRRHRERSDLQHGHHLRGAATSSTSACSAVMHKPHDVKPDGSSTKAAACSTAAAASWPLAPLSAVCGAAATLARMRTGADVRMAVVA